VKVCGNINFVFLIKIFFALQLESMFINFMYKCITHHYLLVNLINNKIVGKTKNNKKLNFNILELSL